MADLFEKLGLQKYRRYFTSQAVKDFDAFLDGLPKKMGQTTLIAAGIIWIAAGASVFFAMTEVQALNQLTAEKLSMEALAPQVPKIVKKPVSQEQLKAFVDKSKSAYGRLSFGVRRSGELLVTSATTAGYREMSQVIDHLHYGGNNWRVDIKEMCVGRECTGGKPMQAVLKISQVNVLD